ncbi:demethoxyubiquinone hydroxylase family protein [Magnetospirillum sp. UT-4]|uniref:demethoxyubiquinone hydroxylase family protein n=1 Tax=Magnetospirillum sp. UT-4 TaxID=2681467 RepID=UPI00138040A1|nr:demethoxyubiquinone hydroxylase family protein [Magnetospirillum sp. UT-4]CAA7619889.1 putative ubiquinone biosynthesis protein COQ7 [Magnetospirillum sp. UT-4]
MTRMTAADRIPNDPAKDELVARFLRVDQAGELGAVRIYQGQRAVLGKGRHGPLLAKMAEQERHHLETFDRQISERQVRPTLLSPLWHVAGFALGAGTALLGERAAMACTVAVEEAIDEHYAAQAEALGDDEAALKATIETFRAEELEHRDIGLANEAEKAPFYPVLSTAIKTGCRLAIWLSERV